MGDDFTFDEVYEDHFNKDEDEDKDKDECSGAGEKSPRVTINDEGVGALPSEHVLEETRHDFEHSTQTRVRRQSSVVSNLQVSDSASYMSDYRVAATDFELLKVIGKGAYGRVLQVRDRTTENVYAMKVLQKGHILQKNNLDYVREERNILSQADHPFVVTLMCAFQTEDKLFLVMEYVAGGELFSHLLNEGIFNESQTRFYASEMILALEYLHQNGIIHRDLKPENVLLDAAGHIRITDFGLAKVDRENLKNARTLCGTDLYMAPEMISGTSAGYGKAVDFWSLGVITFEMLTGDTPFYAKETKRLYRMILTSKPRYPSWLTSGCVNLLKGLLNRNVEQRLGAAESTMFKVRGVQELKDHVFFKGLNWNDLADLKVKPPIVPFSEGADQEDTFNFSSKFTELDPSAVDADEEKRFAAHLENAKEEDFKGFSFTRGSYLSAAIKNLKLDQTPSEGSQLTAAAAQQASPVSPPPLVERAHVPELKTTPALSQVGSPLITVEEVARVDTPVAKGKATTLVEPPQRDEVSIVPVASKTSPCNGGNKGPAPAQEIQQDSAPHLVKSAIPTTRVDVQRSKPSLNVKAKEWIPPWQKKE